MDNSDLQKINKLLLQDIQNLDITDSLTAITGYPDEPQMFRFSANLKNQASFTDGNILETTSSGYSFESPSLALLKCLIELIERFSTMKYFDKDITYSPYNQLKNNALDPAAYSNNKSILNSNMGWIKGFSLADHKAILLPAQSIFYNYKLLKSEPLLTVQISTGAAGGFDFEETLLRGIYEIIERDAFMNIYLAQIKVPKLNIASIDNEKVRFILQKTSRYNLDVCLFDLTSDLGIPCYLGAVIDKTGLGPSVSFGLKASSSQLQAIIGCLEEALLTRPWIRHEMITQEQNEFSINSKDLITIKDRGLFWVSPKMLRHLDFLFGQPLIDVSVEDFNMEPKKELKMIKDIMYKNNFPVYYANLSSDLFPLSRTQVYKAIIPGLQPVFFQEKKPEIRQKRLSQVASFFNIKKININKIPHPFL